MKWFVNLKIVYFDLILFYYCTVLLCRLLSLFVFDPAGSTSLPTTHQGSTHPYHPSQSQALTPYSGTPVPPLYLIRGHTAAFSPSVFASDKPIPVSFNHHYPAVDSSSSIVRIQQGLLARVSHGNTNFITSNSHSAQYQPGLNSPCEYEIG